MSPLRNIAVVEDEATRYLLRELQRSVDALSVRLSSIEARNNALNFFSDSNRPLPSSVPKYTMIFNTDDGFPNVSDGDNWLDPTGATT